MYWLIIACLILERRFRVLHAQLTLYMTLRLFDSSPGYTALRYHVSMLECSLATRTTTAVSLRLIGEVFQAHVWDFARPNTLKTISHSTTI